jgi:hypothetical protein
MRRREAEEEVAWRVRRREAREGVGLEGDEKRRRGRSRPGG